MLTCTFQLDGADYKLKTGDRVVVTPAAFVDKPTWLEFHFRTAEGDIIEVMRNGEPMRQRMGLPIVHDNNIREFVSLLTGFSVDFAPKTREWCICELHER
jgi:hypothetical protein